jgi:nickel/cobalt exporter
VNAVGPDHCAAMATLGTLGPGRRRATFLVALRFAIGHAAVLGGVATFCLLAGVGLSETFERWAEIFGGAVLVALAVAAFLFPNVLRHGHPHLPGHPQEPHSHIHDRVSTAAGALMAVSGVRSLLLALPPLLVGGSLSTSGWTYLPGFALGILWPLPRPSREGGGWAGRSRCDRASRPRAPPGAPAAGTRALEPR